MTGKFSRYQIGMLHMRTETVDFWDEYNNEAGRFPASNFSVIRVRRELLKRSYVGLMLLNRDDVQSADYHRSGGLDANFPLTDRIVINGAIAATSGPDEVNDDGTVTAMSSHNMASSIGFSYDSDLWELKLSHLSIQENFNAEMGFIRRTGIRNTDLWRR